MAETGLVIRGSKMINKQKTAAIRILMGIVKNNKILATNEDNKIPKGAQPVLRGAWRVLTDRKGKYVDSGKHPNKPGNKDSQNKEGGTDHGKRQGLLG
jgi:hypothetical protein